ncbi:hypothetical protein ACFQ1A_29450, partial [Massilia pinisoli]|uniref:hypothetical protein n=1 Tax=Massilia pinisoli TaxID=1772194 RepID=UPI003629615E
PNGGQFRGDSTEALFDRFSALFLKAFSQVPHFEWQFAISTFIDPRFYEPHMLKKFKFPLMRSGVVSVC